MSDTGLFEKFGTSFKNNEIIFKEGEDGNQMYIIQNGSVKISRTIGNREHTIDIIKKGDFFGEAVLLSISVVFDSIGAHEYKIARKTQIQT